jgi:8-amino-7-oxononanoate synthase
MDDFFEKSLKNLKQKDLYRSLFSCDATGDVIVRRNKKNLISFCCNNYLGLSQNALVKKSAIAAIKKFGIGARASRYISGNNALYLKAEKKVAALKKCDDAIIFCSGYATAIGVIPALVNKSDLIIADRLIHSCLIDGSKLAGAKLLRFRHNNILHCREILLQNRNKFKKCLIITEKIFSMDGDLGKIAELLELAAKFNCLLLSDAAHDLWLDAEINVSGSNFFCQTKTGSNPKQISAFWPPFYLQMGTFSKAVGTLGGYIAGDKILIDYLRNFAKSVIYSTALPPSILAATLTSLKIIAQQNPGIKALKNARYFCQLMQLSGPDSAIVVIIIGDNKKVLQIAKKVEEKGFLISAIRPPTVENTKARLRITFCSKHKKSQIKELAQALKNVL